MADTATHIERSVILALQPEEREFVRMLLLNFSIGPANWRTFLDASQRNALDDLFEQTPDQFQLSSKPLILHLITTAIGTNAIVSELHSCTGFDESDARRILGKLS